MSAEVFPSLEKWDVVVRGGNDAGEVGMLKHSRQEMGMSSTRRKHMKLHMDGFPSASSLLGGSLWYCS